MGKTFRLEIPELAAEVERRLQGGDSRRQIKRLQAGRLGLGGQHTLEQIGAAVGKSRPRMVVWMRIVRQQGLDELLGRHQGRGQAPSVTGKVMQALRQGLRRGRRKRAKDAGQWLEQRHGVTLGKGGVRYWLKMRRSPEAPAPDSYPQRRGAK